MVHWRHFQNRVRRVRHGGTVRWYAWGRFKGTGGTNCNVRMAHYKGRSVPKKKQNTNFKKDAAKSIELFVVSLPNWLCFFGTGVPVRS